MMLRFAEEVLLLLLHDDNGKFARVPEWSLRYALGGGVLMDLALENRIDTDVEKLVLIDPTPVGDSLLDPLLEEIAAAEESHDARYWVEVAAGHAWEIREEALARLIERGILQQREDRFLWVLSSRRYPVVDGKAERELKLRIMEVLFSDALPDPRDIVIIGLADACGIFKELLAERELDLVAERIGQVRKMDLIGQAVSSAIWDIETAVAAAMPPLAY